MKASPIIAHSKKTLCIIFIPNKGRLVSSIGNIAQCIAQAREVAIPNPSQFIFKFMRRAKIRDLQYCCNFLQALQIV